MNAETWASLTGAHSPALVGKAAFARVGDAGNQGFGVSFEQVVEFDGRMSQLDQDIQSFQFVPGPATTADQFAHMAAATTSLRLRWGAFFPAWRAWRDTHQTSFSRLSGATAIEFGGFEVKYNAFRNELIAIGGHPKAPPAITDAPPPDAPNSVDKILAFLNSAKWILALGLGAYVLVGTGAIPAIGAALATRKKAA